MGPMNDFVSIHWTTCSFQPVAIGASRTFTSYSGDPSTHRDGSGALVGWTLEPGAGPCTAISPAYCDKRPHATARTTTNTAKACDPAMVSRCAGSGVCNEDARIDAASLAKMFMMIRCHCCHILCLAGRLTRAPKARILLSIAHPQRRCWNCGESGCRSV